MVSSKNAKNINADGEKRNKRPRVPPPVTRAETAEYAFALLKSLAALTRGRPGMGLATYLIEMAALEMAAVNGRRRFHGGADNRPTI